MAPFLDTFSHFLLGWTHSALHWKVMGAPKRSEYSDAPLKCRLQYLKLVTTLTFNLDSESQISHSAYKLEIQPPSSPWLSIAYLWSWVLLSGIMDKCVSLILVRARNLSQSTSVDFGNTELFWSLPPWRPMLGQSAYLHVVYTKTLKNLPATRAPNFTPCFPTFKLLESPFMSSQSSTPVSTLLPIHITQKPVPLIC